MTLFAGILFVCGCGATERHAVTGGALRARAVTEDEWSRELDDRAADSLLSRARRTAGRGSTPATLNVLAISGGGDYGAFGAGVLVGWGRVSDAGRRRPDFDLVSGVSAGALLAPFAFIGTDDACLAVERLCRNPRDDWFTNHGLLGLLPTSPSFMSNAGLERSLAAVLTPALVEQLAARSRDGKLLLVSATDLDLGRVHFWDVGAEAEAVAGSGGGADRLRRIFMASVAIPAVFPPVPLDGALYADGGITPNLFLRFDPGPDGLIARWREAHPNDPPPRVRYWVIVNHQLNAAPRTVRPRWPAVIGAGITASIRAATLVELRALAAEADLANATQGADVEVNAISIPDHWRQPVPGDFRPETMRSLADLGRTLGADPSSWERWTMPTPLRPRDSGSSSSPPEPVSARRAGPAAGERAQRTD
ncbi:MAG: patatin-like phospholipase family protein [Phycisphaerae bacterium]